MSSIKSTPVIILKSWGLKRLKLSGKGGEKYCVMPHCDLAIDCRGVKEHGLHRNDPEVYQKEIEEHCPATVQAMETTITESLKHVKDRRFGEHDALTRPYVVCCLCAYGINRSATTKLVLAKRLKGLGYAVEVQ